MVQMKNIRSRIIEAMNNLGKSVDGVTMRKSETVYTKHAFLAAVIDKNPRAAGQA